MNRESIWFALRNKEFRTLWVVTLISGSAVAAYNTAAIWLMNSLASSSPCCFPSSGTAKETAEARTAYGSLDS